MRLGSALVSLALVLGTAATAGADSICSIQTLSYGGSSSSASSFDSSTMTLTNVTVANSALNFTASSTVTSGSAQPTGVVSTLIDANHTNYILAHLIASWSVTTTGTGAVKLWYSVDNGRAWYQINSRSSTPTAQVADVDPMEYGVNGNQLLWKATFSGTCSGNGNNVTCDTATLNSLSLTYWAMPAGTYESSQGILAGNVILRAMYETPSSAWTQVGAVPSYAPRGHVKMQELFNPDTGADDGSRTVLWDAGTVLASTSPTARSIYYNNGGTNGSLVTPILSALAALILPTTPTNTRTLTTSSGALMYDFTGDGTVDDNDAARVVSFTRGYAVDGSTLRPSRLRGIYHSSATLVGPPGTPWWLEGSATPGAESSTWNTFASNNATRQARLIVGAMDGMVHAFNAGSFRWGDDPTTTPVELHGYFATATGSSARDYGDGSEVWSIVPQALIGPLRNNPPDVVGNDSQLSAMIDGPMSAADIILYGTTTTARTVVVAPLGPIYKAVTAIDVSSPSAPAPLWSVSWTDPDYYGLIDGISIAPVTTPGGRQWELAVPSGVADHAVVPYIFMVDAPTGQTDSGTLGNGRHGSSNYSGKIALQSTLTYGVAGSPVMVDSDGDGEIDRVYAATTDGNIYKINTASYSVCKLASIGETVYAPMAVQVTSGTAPLVRIMVGSGDNPYLPDTSGGSYSFRIYEDTDTLNGCTSLGSPALKVALATGEKVWTTPVVSGSNVYFVTSTGTYLHVCDGSGSSHVYGYSLPAQSGSTSYAQLFSPVAYSGSDPVGGLQAYDGHLVISGTSGQTTLLGAATWNNQKANSSGSSSSQPGLGESTSGILPTVNWYEQ